MVHYFSLYTYRAGFCVPLFSTLNLQVHLQQLMHILARDLGQCFWMRFSAMEKSLSFWIVLVRMLAVTTARILWMQELCAQVHVGSLSLSLSVSVSPTLSVCHSFSLASHCFYFFSHSSPLSLSLLSSPLFLCLSHSFSVSLFFSCLLLSISVAHTPFLSHSFVSHSLSLTLFFLLTLFSFTLCLWPPTLSFCLSCSFSLSVTFFQLPPTLSVSPFICFPSVSLFSSYSA